jgi:hypothetical protein
MKTNWVAPGEGATIWELTELLDWTPMRFIFPPYTPNMKTNLAISSTGVVEEYDRQRFAVAEVKG